MESGDDISVRVGIDVTEMDLPGDRWRWGVDSFYATYWRTVRLESFPIPPLTHRPTEEAQPLEVSYTEQAYEGIRIADYLFPYHYRYGRIALNSFVERSGDLKRFLSIVPSTNQYAFLDIESTGLTGSANSYAFLIGLARPIPEGIFIRQLFLTNPGRERALLQATEEFCSPASVLITFNGRSFDVPLLRTRALITRTHLALPVEHLDLLPPARQLWRPRLQSCALSNLERHILDVWRIDDIPSSLIPELYYRYLHSADLTNLQPVFAHNQQDILAMVALTSVIAQSHTQPATLHTHPRDAIAIGRILLRAGQVNAAEQSFHRALTGSLSVEERAAVFWQLAQCHLQRSDTSEALKLMHTAARLGERPGFQAAIWLAKFYEHQAGSLQLALEMAQRARQLATAPSHLASLQRRLDRIQAKQTNQYHPSRHIASAARSPHRTSED
ncbi:MAG: ribonuclease H-like domain-containing protein [Chloroflexi bacterium]|nr:ribonuclease H-like domain-containing protein [Chloroflexota bacterium]